MSNLKMRCPIHYSYILYRKICILTQLWGENKNALFYGPEGHLALDFRTSGPIKYTFHNLMNYITNKRNSDEAWGRVPIIAPFDGFLDRGFNDDPIEGIGMFIISADGNYKINLFHLDKLRRWKGDGVVNSHTKKNGPDFVKRGTLIAWAGNTGRFTTGAHLHFVLYKKMSNGSWEKIDPLPYLQDNVIYNRASTNLYFYKGQQIDEFEKDKLLKQIKN